MFVYGESIDFGGFNSSHDAWSKVDHVRSMLLVYV